ncbi:methyltransferase domain-containing protein [Mycolicibacterium elephantis]|uniref:SAM-dependent methyltransferase n=1 Tax=Mycolicibacterium elephantis TaxID=81858 RepID=A0A1X0D6J7_9MYCO|nr:class I SAM-dependent methyltransferase [Mycolicibacterium elephantis]ORA67849.1 SAM-dependent methyltransferase [Mycolicibacterium elephantis]
MTEPDFLQRTRHGYDLTAGPYAERFHEHLRDKPLDRAMLSGFAGLVDRGGVVADVGCGTGATTQMLSDHGVDVVGIDLSPNMIAEARRRNPDLPFQVGSMTDLGFDDGRLHGICAWYSVIHVPDELLPQVFAEFRRVLRPNGWLLLAFQVGEQPREFRELFGERVSLTFYRRQPDAVALLLEEAGFMPYAGLVREPNDDGFESTPHAFLMAQNCAPA